MFADVPMCNTVRRSPPVLFLTILLLQLLCAHAQPKDPCSSITITDGQILYGFPPCSTPDTKRADLAAVTFDPKVAETNKDVLITVRALYGTISVSVLDTTSSNVQQLLVLPGVGAQILATPNVTKGGKLTIQLAGDDGYTKWQIAAFSQPSNVKHHPDERALLGRWAAACCPKDQNVACSSLASWAAGAADGGEDACKVEHNMCNTDGRLVRLQFAFQGSTNAFPSCLSPPEVLQEFTALKVLNLSNLDVAWPMHELATVLSKLPDLEELVLDGNIHMAGVFYAGGCVLFNKGKKLRSFSAVSTNVSGNVPECLVRSAQLEELNLYGTAVSGQLPDFSATAPLMYFNASAHDWDPISRMLTGTLPPSISNLTKLAVLALNDNLLEGALPDLPPSLEILVMQHNKMSGALPQSLYKLQNLRRFHMEQNNLTGTLSPDLGKLNALEELWLTGNQQLEGSIDFEWTGTNLQSVHLSHTKISGAIPASFARLPNLRQISVTNNPLITDQTQFAESLTDGNSIIWYNVSGNGIKTLPEGLQKLGAFSNFQIIDFVEELTGNSLNVFDVSNNAMSMDPFPAWFLTSLPNATRTEVLFGQSHSYIYKVAGDPVEDSNILACPSDRATAQAATYIAAELQMTTYCQRRKAAAATSGAVETVTLQKAAAEWATLPVAAPSLPSISATGSQQNPPPSRETAPITAAVDGRGKGGNGASDDLGLILGCTIGATVAFGALMFVVFKYVLQLRRKSFVLFKEDALNNGTYPIAATNLGDSSSGVPVSHLPPPVADLPVPNKAIQKDEVHLHDHISEEAGGDVETGAARLSPSANVTVRSAAVQDMELVQRNS